jgi:hypothetical protein
MKKMILVEFEQYEEMKKKLKRSSPEHNSQLESETSTDLVTDNKIVENNSQILNNKQKQRPNDSVLSKQVDADIQNNTSRSNIGLGNIVKKKSS